jgi:hypothetical protein
MPTLIFPFYLVIHRDMKRAPRVRAFLNFVTAGNKNDTAGIVRWGP